MPVSITKVIVITHENMKLPWQIDSSETIDGIECVALRKMDCGFCRFVSGSTLGMRNRDGLVQLQQRCVNAILEATKETQVLCEDQGETAKKKARSQALGKMKDCDVSQLINVDMPDGVTIKMKASLSLNVSPVVELTATALESIRSMIVSLPDDAPLHTRNPGTTLP